MVRRPPGDSEGDYVSLHVVVLDMFFAVLAARQSYSKEQCYGKKSHKCFIKYSFYMMNRYGIDKFNPRGNQLTSLRMAQNNISILIPDAQH